MGVGKRLSPVLQTIRQTHLYLSEHKLKANLPKEQTVFDSYHFTSMEHGIWRVKDLSH